VATDKGGKGSGESAVSVARDPALVVSGLDDEVAADG